MTESSRTNHELIEENSFLKQRIQELEHSEAEREQVEEALRESEKHYRQLAEDMPALICTFLPDSTLTYVNSAYCELFQKRSDELIGQKFLYFIKDEATRETVRRQYMALTPENSVNTYEHAVIISDGTSQYHWHRWTDRAFFKDNGEIDHFQSIGQDITDRKLMEDALVAESHQLEETNTALRVILQRREEDQKEMERKFTINIQKLVLPNLEKLRGLSLNDIQTNCLDIVAANLQQVTSPFLQNLAACFADFTPREIQVANMIRQGKTSKEIAAIFNSSIRSVDFHRDNIRKKLDLSHQKSNLRTFLMKLSE
jgi:PAS domain S-box-containing protein